MTKIRISLVKKKIPDRKKKVDLELALRELKIGFFTYGQFLHLVLTQSLDFQGIRNNHNSFIAEFFPHEILHYRILVLIQVFWFFKYLVSPYLFEPKKLFSRRSEVKF